MSRKSFTKKVSCIFATHHISSCPDPPIGWPSVGLRLTTEANMTDILTRLMNSKPATSRPPAINVYTSKTMPARYHFNPSRNERIAPLYIVPRIGWAITNHHEHEEVMQGHYTPLGVSLAIFGARTCSAYICL